MEVRIHRHSGYRCPPIPRQGEECHNLAGKAFVLGQHPQNRLCRGRAHIHSQQ